MLTSKVRLDQHEPALPGGSGAWRRKLWTRFATAAWVQGTPLGRPVEPEVNST